MDGVDLDGPVTGVSIVRLKAGDSTELVLSVRMYKVTTVWLWEVKGVVLCWAMFGWIKGGDINRCNAIWCMERAKSVGGITFSRYAGRGWGL